MNPNFFSEITKVDISDFPKPTISEATVMSFIRPILEKEHGLGNPPPFVDPDLWKLFNMGVHWGNADSEDLTTTFTTLYKLLSSLTHNAIMLEAKRNMEACFYSWAKSISILSQIALSGIIDKESEGAKAFVYCKPGLLNKYGGSLFFYFYVSRKKKKLYLCAGVPYGNIGNEPGDLYCFG